MMASDLIRASEELELFDAPLDDDADLQRALELSLAESKGECACRGCCCRLFFPPTPSSPLHVRFSRLRTGVSPFQGASSYRGPTRAELEQQQLEAALKASMETAERRSGATVSSVSDAEEGEGETTPPFGTAAAPSSSARTWGGANGTALSALRAVTARRAEKRSWAAAAVEEEEWTRHRLGRSVSPGLPVAGAGSRGAVCGSSQRQKRRPTPCNDEIQSYVDGGVRGPAVTQGQMGSPPSDSATVEIVAEAATASAAVAAKAAAVGAAAAKAVSAAARAVMTAAAAAAAAAWAETAGDYEPATPNSGCGDAGEEVCEAMTPPPPVAATATDAWVTPCAHGGPRLRDFSCQQKVRGGGSLNHLSSGAYAANIQRL